MATVENMKDWDDGTTEYKLCGGGVEVVVYSFGGIIQSIRVPNSEGDCVDVALGYDTPQEFGPGFFGALIGRFANRIDKGQFSLDGKDYLLATNNGPNALHGGVKGFDKRHWGHSIADNKLKLTYTSVDGEENYPGTLKVTVTYELTADAQLIIDYTATTDNPTILNLTNHTYFNLEGQDKGNVFSHKVQLQCDYYTPKDDLGIPTGEIAAVDGTSFDLRSGKVIDADALAAINNMGYDHNFVVAGQPGELRFVARVTAGGRVLEAYSTQPGVQFYTSGFLDTSNNKGGCSYGKYSGLCLETQNYPDAPNKANFPNCVLRPEETYHHTTTYKFSTA